MSEREQVDVVFCLGGGELADEPWVFSVEDDESAHAFTWWYEGVPHYDERPDDHECRTAIVCELYGQCKTPEGWMRVASWTTSGEAECWCMHEDEKQGVCPVCEDEGLVYLGDGWREVVFRQINTEEEE